jgi:flavin reductase (DIM6/NTAB) family NADH-FMN oxidoreductase RutF
MPLSGPAFREALAHFATGVTVVTARVHGADGDRLVGFTATSFASVSLAPPLILVCVNHTASAYDGFVRADIFGVSVLAEHQYALAEQFARKGIDRFADVKLVAASEAPLLEGAIAQLECRTHSRHEVGDHTVVFGEVLSARTSPARPLLHFARHFATLGGDPAPPKDDEAIDET